MDIHLIPRTQLNNRVKSYLQKYVVDMIPSGNTKLPPENDISASLGVSRVTVRRALGELEKEGVVIRIHGRGTFVNPEAVNIQANLMAGEEFSRLIRSCGYEPSFEVVSLRRETPDSEVTRALRLTGGCQVYRMEKLYRANGRPAIASIDYVSCETAGDAFTRESLENMTVFDFLRSCRGRLIVRDKITLESVTRSEAAAIAPRILGVESESVLLFRGINYDQENVPVLYSLEIFDTKVVKFSLMRTKNLYEEG